MTIRTRKYIALAVCLLFTTGIVLGGSGVTLCIGDCGHSKFETMCLPSADEGNHTSTRAAIDEAHSVHIHCGNCSDVAIDGPQWLRRSRLTSGDRGAVTSPAHAVGATRTIDIVPGGTRSIGGHLLIPLENLTMSQSTTVLQC